MNASRKFTSACGSGELHHAKGARVTCNGSRLVKQGVRVRPSKHQGLFCGVGTGPLREVEKHSLGTTPQID
eukprot:scaffold649_cov347-Pavlova_lutheri.AAC.42